MLVQLTRFATAMIDMGAGDDDFFVTDPEDLAHNRGIYADILQVAMGAGADKVHIEGTIIGPEFQSTGILLIQTGAEADEVTLNFATVDLPSGYSYHPVIHGNLGLYTYDDSSEADADRVFILHGQIEGFASIGLGAGDDVFDFQGNVGSLFIEAGDGADVGKVSAFVDGYLDNQCRIHMGGGDDTLTLGNVRAADKLTLDGGEGGDSLRYEHGLNAVDQVFENGWEYINGLPTWPLEIAPGPGGGIFGP
jgi:hypothetical protein